LKKTYLEKIISTKVLIGANLLIVILAEVTGSFFLESGLIHFIAIFFLVLGISRFFVHYEVFDQFLKPLIVATVIALVIVSGSHLVEHIHLHDHQNLDASRYYNNNYFINVVNVYMMIVLMVALSAKYFLVKKDRSFVQASVLSLAFVVSVGVTLLGFQGHISISTAPGDLAIYWYSLAVLMASVAAIYYIYKIGKAVSIMEGFVQYLVYAFALITLSALLHALHEVIKNFNVPEIQIIYLSHFLLYAALSLIFLAFPRIRSETGIYAKLQ